MTWWFKSQPHVSRKGNVMIIVEEYEFKQDAADAMRDFKQGLKRRQFSYTWYPSGDKL